MLTPGGLVVMRADASAGLGVGHVMRCLTLADGLAGLGLRTVFCSRDLPAALQRRLGAGGHGLIALTGADTQQAEAEEIAAQLARQDLSPDLLVCDHYQRAALWETRLRDTGAAILAIDDLADRPHDADLLLDTTHGRDPQDYAGLLPKGARCLTGADHALLRPAFAAARSAALARHDAGGPVRRIVISLGGSDPDNVTGRLLAALGGTARGAGRSGDIVVDVILGGASVHLDTVAAQIAGLSFAARLHSDVTDMAGFLAGADLAFGAAGSSAWERCCLGLPTLMLVLADNQTQVALGLEQAGAAISLGRAENLADDAIRRGLEALLDDPGQRLRLSRAARRVCDGQGLARVGAALLALDRPAAGAPGLKHRPDHRFLHRPPVSLRPATKADAESLFHWQCDPLTRRHSRNPEPPAYAEHLAWFARRLERARGGNAPFYIIEHAGTPAGMIRLDPVTPPPDATRPDTAYLDETSPAGTTHEVSILIAPDRHGRGLGASALKLLRLHHPHLQIQAFVAVENSASQRLFETVGYERVDATSFRSLPVAQDTPMPGAPPARPQR